MIAVARTALITGATGGLGRVVAADLARDGLRLGLLGSTEERLMALAVELELDTGTWAVAAADLRDGSATRQAVETVGARLGGPDIAIHLVGGWTGGTPLVDIPETDLTSMLEQHAWTTFHVARAVAPGMVERGWGRIVAVSSPLAAEPTARMAAYAAGKAAMEAILGSLARDLAGSGVTVNVIRVHTIDADHQRDRAPSARDAGWTTPAEISAAIRYLCSEAAGVVSGARVPLFGAG